MFLVNSESEICFCQIRFIAIFLKTVFFCTFPRLKIIVLWRKIVQNLLIFVYLFCPKNSTTDFTKTFIGMVGRIKLRDPSLNCIFNALSIGVQYTLSFQWTNFGLKCLFLLFTIHRLQQLPKEESNVLNTLDNIWQPKNDVVSPKQTVFVFPIKKEF